MTVAYEPGMKIIYDSTSQRVTVCFRGKVRRLEGLYTTSMSAKEAGEAYCRAAGWKPKVPVVSGKSLLRHPVAPPYLRT
jgi:hypothetical protein